MAFVQTPLSCPDCPGVLTVRTEGSEGYIHFECRIGHTFSLRDLLTAKEDRIEERLWAAVVALEELAALLQELHAARRAAGTPYETRCRQALGLAHALRALIERNSPIDLDRVNSDGGLGPAGEAA